MIGRTISHYHITRKLGAGGMGEVYLATDTKLNRPVALKFLPEGLSRDPEARARLLREAQAASQLNHSNILTIYGVEEADGRDFIVMEYIEGTALGSAVESKAASLDRVLDLAIQMGEGLDKAHRAGIVHRDLKPANILIDADGRAKILDFGLAKLRGAGKLTQTGSTTGTAAYMSPEQAQGAEADARSDLFSFGVVLYEMIAGRPPFSGDHQAAMAYAIVNENPEPLARYKADVPVELQRLITKCLAKFPSERYQSAADLVADLRALRTAIHVSSPRSAIVAPMKRRSRLVAALVVAGLAILAAGTAVVWHHIGSSGASTASGRKMLVVLPFENLGSTEQEYFADGITEEITARLANVSGLGVISRTTAIRYKKSEKSLRDIGQELGADYVLEGTIRWDKSDNAQSVRITPRLIRVNDDTHLWADVYERPLEHVFAVQAEIAEKVAAAMNVTLMEPEHQRLTAKPTEDVEAYDCYLRANDMLIHGETRESRLSAQRLYEAAVRLDRRFAQAWSALSQVCTELYWHHGRNQQNLDRAKEAVQTALTINPDLPEAHVALGVYEYHVHQYDSALVEFDVAQHSQPNNTVLLLEIGYVKQRQGKHLEALELFRRVLSLDPQAAQAAFLAAEREMWMRDYASAEKDFDRAITAAPDLFFGTVAKSLTRFLRDGNMDQARLLLPEAADMTNADALDLANWAYLKLCDGQYQEILAGLKSTDPEAQSGILSERAFAYVHLHNPGAAKACYDSARAISERAIALVPDEAGYHADLGIANAGLGRREAAIREGERAVELSPLARDMYNDMGITINLAHIYAWEGEDDKALDILEYLLSIPSPLSGRMLAVDPTWASLRNNPRFVKLVQQPDKVS
ncbi:MAG: protein kinase [candidate division Zixibacteria bacterium]|nr:protein kinase [candidate division Zixibacteria bacterium]